MRSYEAARSLFSFLAFLAWSVVVIGGIVAVSAASSVSSRYGGGAAFLAMMPGMSIAIAGFILVAFVQMGRATVDTAEYTQQMLKIARDQLEVSRQGQRTGSFEAAGFATVAEKLDESPGPSFGDLETSAPAPEEDGQAALAGVESNQASSVLTDAKNADTPTITEFRGRAITHANDGFTVAGELFETLELAKKNIDVRRKVNARLPGHLKL